ncbi:MAG: indole-3-glycerol phosphate synthase TrpC [Pseudomonadota bacterium]
MSDTLQKIVADKRVHIAARKAETSQAALDADAKARPAPRGFIAALKNDVAARGAGLIAEVKKASPSKGLIRADFDPVAIARAYDDAGASCISVLTDAPYFQGSEADLAAVAGAVGRPALRKDFIVDPFQIVEARALGADAILLIMAALDDGAAQDLEAVAADLGMDVLVEVHDARELERALRLRTQLIGVNNRNLKTLEVDLRTTLELAPRVPRDRIVVCESGLESGADFRRALEAGARAALVGESFMRSDPIAPAVRGFLTDALRAAA